MPQHVVPAAKRSFARALRRQQTALESLLWRELRDRRLDGWKFRRQVPIEGFVADFVCFDARLIVEADGPVHSDPVQQSKDIERDAVLRRAGFLVLRFNGDAVRDDLAKVVAGIREALKQSPSPDP